MLSIKHFLPVLFFLGILITQDASSQHKFELSASIDPLIVPINTVTFVESGPGYYDIRGRRKVTQAGSAYFRYWPFRHVGISIGAHIRTFGSSIDFAIPDFIVTIPEPMIERSHPFSASGWGPSLSVLYRKERWQGSIGISIFELENQKYTSYYGTTGVSVFSGGNKFAEIEVMEEAYGPIGPISYDLIQLEAQYNIIDNFFFKFGFEVSLSHPDANYYTLLISGFTPQTPPGSHVLNDYKMRSKIASVSLGVGYTLGFGKYRTDKKAASFD